MHTPRTFIVYGADVSKRHLRNGHIACGHETRKRISAAVACADPAHDCFIMTPTMPPHGWNGEPREFANCGRGRHFYQAMHKEVREHLPNCTRLFGPPNQQHVWGSTQETECAVSVIEKEALCWGPIVIVTSGYLMPRLRFYWRDILESRRVRWDVSFLSVPTFNPVGVALEPLRLVRDGLLHPVRLAKLIAAA